MVIKEGVLVILAVALILLLALGGWYLISKPNIDGTNTACKEIGFREYDGSFGKEICIDYDDNEWYVRMECKGFLEGDCKAKPITRGYVEVK